MTERGNNDETRVPRAAALHRCTAAPLVMAEHHPPPYVMRVTVREIAGRDQL